MGGVRARGGAAAARVGAHEAAPHGRRRRQITPRHRKLREPPGDKSLTAHPSPHMSHPRFSLYTYHRMFSPIYHRMFSNVHEQPAAEALALRALRLAERAAARPSMLRPPPEPRRVLAASTGEVFARVPTQELGGEGRTPLFASRRHFRMSEAAMDLVAATTAAFDGARAAAAERRGMRPACTAAECAKWYAGARAPDALRTLGALLAEGEAARVGRHHTPGGPFVGGAPSTALTSRGGATTSAVPESPHPQSPHSPVLGFDPPPLLPSDPSECLHLGLALAGRCAALLAGYAHSAEAAYAASLAPWLRQFPFLPLPPSSDPPVAALSPPPLPLPNPPAVAPTPPHPHSHPTSPSLPPHLTPTPTPP